jgi:catechol 2,3-dioxygenase-like lactoylglutathione lyase family enzyme
VKIEGMNHFNVLTDDVEKTRAFYCDVLGLEKGDRPPFGFDGLWLYAAGKPILHVSKRVLPREREGVIDHIAFTAKDLDAATKHLKAKGIEFNLYKQVGTGIWQVFFLDPMGAKVELDFDPAERAPEGVPVS